MTPNEENLSMLLRRWSTTVPKSLKETTSSSNGLIKDSSALKTEAPAIPEVRRRKHRFSADTANDLLFWGCHLCIVAISLGIMWTKMDSTAKALQKLLLAQNEEVALVRKQTAAVEKQAFEAQVAAENARQAEHTRALQFSAAANTLNAVLAQVSEIQANIKATLAKANEINERVLSQSEATKNAAVQAQSAAQSAAGAAGGAASAASRAAATSSRTGNVIAQKVVTAQDKRQMEAQQRALARKQLQLSRTIKEVKKNGPNLIQQIFH